MSPSTIFPSARREFASELKFLVDAILASQIRAWSRERLAADPNASGDCGDSYRVTSIYYDTPDLAIFHRRGWFRHSKFRIRRYGAGVIFLERKLKIAGRVAKHRSALASDELVEIESLPAHARWFAQKTAARRLRPVCQIDYHRTARVSMLPSGPIRLTLDEAVCAIRSDEPSFHHGAEGARLTDRVVLELKFRRELPVLFRELVGCFTLNPLPFSKYRTAVQMLGLAPGSACGAPAGRAPAESSVACPSF
jgi:hypothetical protein